ncbi:hypothetical protein GCM10025768_15620 [Microbacterium pseudoresistens]|uniref:Very-short-patch-repair endonuclease n=1 Tax=Microbacterium pseudoresistens TaxID=640634 RepID=A0A7Y9ESQ9_9MICO|nr:type IV toxin-antitoxin system AbiEi family antitoxin domain-containing protein [Microbacterium pseudoresistens]NYD53086.1 very-short-patch-repair endonuclease [Microbacterium pseudoresistens]
MLSASDTIRRLGGLARGADLQRIGFDRAALSRLVASGQIERLRPGVFGVAPISPAVRAATMHGGALTCVSVLRAHGVWTLPADDGPHVWLGAGRHGHPHDGCSCTPHYYRGRPPLGTATIPTALLHLRRCAGDEAFFAALESTRAKRLLNRTAVARIRSALPANARWLVDLSRSDSGSGLESLLRLRMHVLGIRLDCQVPIAGVGRVDFVIEKRLIIEADGQENHAGPDKRHKDLVRDAAASALGYETLHFDYAQIVHDWPTVQRSILAALHRGQTF